MTEPTKTRPGDQPLPTAGRECVQDALIALIQERRDLGVQRYGSALMTHNGRDAGRDALEEALDLTVYLMQLRMEIADLRAARDRTIAYLTERHQTGSTGIHPRRIIGLLSLTWPDGNYEAAPEAGRG